MSDRDAALGRAWRDDAPWDLLTRLTELPERFGGHSGEERAAEMVADAFREAGLRDVREEPFEMTRWERGETALTVDLGERERSFEALSLPYSPAGEVAGPLVDVGYGTPDELAERDVEGAVVVAGTDTSPDTDRHHHRMEKVGHAAAAGAAAFVFANHVPGQLPPTGALDPAVSIPCIGVSRETGAWLREYDGERVRVRVDAATEPAESQNVRAALGPDTDDAVLLLAHYDAHDVGEGALDNGCGVAVLLGAVRLLKDLDPQRRVEVAAVGCEELGLFGSRALAERVNVDRLHAVVNVDGAGRHRNLSALTHCSEGTGRVVREVSEALDHPIAVDDRPHPYSDHWPFLQRGVPTVQFHSKQPGEESRWERGWTHTRADTLDKAEARTIRTHAMLIGLVAERLTTADVAPLDASAVRARLRDLGAEPGMRAAGIWPDRWQ